MKKGFVFYYVAQLGYVIENYCANLSSHRPCVVYDTVEQAQNAINQLIMN